ncbi:MAG: NUDIX hydrolase [Opitutales bacterium]|nr:NUDIX hydrolase [Opitutales bacterium]
MLFKISCLLFIRNSSGHILLIKRKKPPNIDTWSPPGGKLEMTTGESPYECAKREAYEETRLNLCDQDLNLFGYVSEKSYEGNGHWLMFLFDCLPILEDLPNEIDEGYFNFFSREEIESLCIPPSDHKLVWPFYDRKDEGFWGVRTDCSKGIPNLEIEANPTQYIKEDR